MTYAAPLSTPRRHGLDDVCHIMQGMLPRGLVPDPSGFDRLWALHPDAYREIMIHGRPVRTPRWEKAFGRDYRYAGRTNDAAPVPALLAPLGDWCRSEIDPRLNGYLVNWHDGRLGHYHGAHRDSTKGLVVGAPIVTISLGEGRVFRLRPWQGKGFTDFKASHGAWFLLPWSTNLAWTHEVPRLACDTGQRISVTLRAFDG